MEAIWNKIATEAGLIALILLVANVALWRELLKARADIVLVLKDSLAEKTSIITAYQEFKNVISANTKVIEENNARLEAAEDAVRDLQRGPVRRHG